ncbi:MAG: hypothetical protein ACFFBP_14215 [Promethearchaeota archaeon]
MTIPLTVSIQINCPICSKMGIIKVEENIVDQSESGITAINVMPKLVCDHSFVAYIDKNLVVRDCFVCDFKVDLPQFQIDMPMGPSEPNFDIDIIKFNLLPSLMANILTGVYFNRKVAVINDLDFLNESFLKFFKYVLQDSFKYDLNFILSPEYNRNKKQYKNHLVLKGNEVVYDKKNMIENKKAKIQNTIIQRFFSEYDSQSGLIIFKNEITKLFKLSQELIELDKNLKKNEDFTSKKAIMHINKKYNTNVTYPYVSLLMDIIKHYFMVELKKASDSGDLLGLI